MESGVRNRKNKSSPKANKSTKGKIEEIASEEDHAMLKKSIEKLKHLNENISRDAVSTTLLCMLVIVLIGCITNVPICALEINLRGNSP